MESTRQKCEDLEACSRRNNLRIVGLKEGAEGNCPMEFIATLIKDSLRLDDMPLLDCAHRALHPRPADGGRPWDFIVRVHFFHIKEGILCRLRDDDTPALSFDDRPFYIFQDFTPAISKLRASYNDTKRLLRANFPEVKYGLRYPAQLWLIHDGKRHIFKSAEEAASYVNLHVKK